MLALVCKGQTEESEVLVIALDLRVTGTQAASGTRATASLSASAYKAGGHGQCSHGGTVCSGRGLSESIPRGRSA